MLDNNSDIEYWEDAWSERNGTVVNFEGSFSRKVKSAEDKRLNSLRTGNVRVFVIRLKKVVEL